MTPPFARLSLAGVCLISALLAACSPALGSTGFGFLPGSKGFAVGATKLDGGPETQAGAHPYQLGLSVNFEPGPEQPGQPGKVFPAGDLRQLRFDLPEGLVGNPTVVGECTLAEFNTPRSSPFEESASGESCPGKSQVGVVALHSSFGTRTFGLFNLAPPPGVVAELGFAPYGEPVAFLAQVHNGEGEYRLTMEADNFPQTLPVDGAEVTVWGTPWAVSHDVERGDCLNETEPSNPWAKCSVGPPKTNQPQAFLTLPDSCTGPLLYKATASSWQEPDSTVSATAVSRDAGGEPVGLGGCEQLEMKTLAWGQPTSQRASSATGFEFNLELNQEGLLEPNRLAPSQMREAVVSLPEGMSINPSVGAGLGVCTPAQYEAETAASRPGAACPNESKIGDFRAESPLLKEAINGSIFLAKPFDNPFGSLIGVYLIAKSSAHGILVKVPGELVPDAGTGRLTAIFQQLPQLPYSHLRVFFREGQRAPLASPPSCGAYPLEMDLNPWLDPEAVLHRSSEFTISSGVGGGACPAPGLPPFSPLAADGSLNSNAGSYSPYYLHLTRTDTEQEITSYSTVLPPGLTGKLAGLTLCPDADIAAAKAKRGTEEAESPSCPRSSEVGHTVTGYGLGGVLDYSAGRLYMAGPYRGAPLSLVAVNPVLVGPFDLGVIIVRSAIRINPLTAQVSLDTSGENPFPHIIDGIPLHLRDVRVYISRPDFTLNPTSCEPFQASSTVLGAGPRLDDPSDDVPATVTGLYQATNCAALGFKPHLGLKLTGATRHSGFPGLRAVVRERPGDANIGSAVVTLPHAEFLAQSHLREVCRRKLFEAEACPPASVYGHAAAFTPLLSEPLRGPVYLVSSAHPVPDLVVALRGDGGIAINLVGRISSYHQAMRASFEGLPDAPASKFVLTLQGGRKGLLENSPDLCAAPTFATARLVGQDNATETGRIRMQVDCGSKHRGGKAAR